MEALLLKILNMSITASYVIVVVLALRLLLAKAPKKYSYLLWSIVGFRLICPISFSSVISVLNMLDLSPAQTGAPRLEYIPGDIGTMTNPSVATGITPVNTAIGDILPVPTTMASVNPLQVWITIGTILWCVGIAALLIYAVISYVKLKGRMATAILVEGNVYQSDQISSPFILGFIKPKVYIPYGLGGKEKDYILRHETYHIRRKDNIIKPLALAILVVHWFNPLVWLAFALMTKDMEMSCDEAVLSTYDTGIARDYSISLLSLATNRRYPYASPLAFGESGIKQRVKNVLNFKKPKVWVTLVAAVLCVAVIAACGANPRNGDAPLPPGPENEENDQADHRVPNNNSQENQKPEDPNSQVQQLLYALFDSGDQMLFTLDVAEHEPRIFETSNRWHAERYSVLLSHYSWELVQADAIPSNPDYTLTIYSGDKSKFFRFYAASNAVLYLQDGIEQYYMTTVRREGGGSIAKTIRAEYDGYEGPLDLTTVETSSDDFNKVARLFMQEYGRLQFGRSPGSTYAITDFKVLEVEVYFTEEGDSPKFCFTTTFAVKPVIFDDNSPWWAGGTEEGSGELEGYIKVFQQMRLEREDNIWRCTDAGTGGISLD